MIDTSAPGAPPFGARLHAAYRRQFKAGIGDLDWKATQTLKASDRVGAARLLAPLGRDVVLRLERDAPEEIVGYLERRVRRQRLVDCEIALLFALGMNATSSAASGDWWLATVLGTLAIAALIAVGVTARWGVAGPS